MDTSSQGEWDRVWVGAHLATMAQGAVPYGTVEDGAVAVRGGRIAWLGAAAAARVRAAERNVPVEECRNLWLTPGFIDCHTHLVYGGSRVAEFEQRLCGSSYEDIARGGGGIQSTVNATRAADAESLLASAMHRARRLISEGVTTVEIKSGYGLDLDTERRMLEVARELGRRLPLTVKTTYLGLHALPVEFRDDRAGYVERVCGSWLASLVAAGLVDAVDGFCENIGFTLAETEKFLQAARGLGLRAHLHAGQLTDMGAAELAAKHRALSVDHLEYLNEPAVHEMARAGTVAVLLPAAYYTLRQSVPPPVDLLRRARVPMAVATDCNPGTAPCTSLLLVLNMACTLFGLTPHEALSGVTRHAAQALGAAADLGTLEVGKRADFALWRIERPAELCYHLGTNPCVGVVRGGQPVSGIA